MPAQKKDPSVRARRNKAAGQAKLSVVELVDYSGWTLAELRAEVDERNADRPEGAWLPRTGGKAKLVEGLAADDLPTVPDMPDHPPRYDSDGNPVELEWHAQTRAWWRDVWTSPMSSEWDRSDLHNVFVVALLYDDIWTASTPKERKDALAEYRLQRADLGLSPYSRRRLEWTIETADEAKAKGEQRRSRSTPASPKKKDPPADPRSILSAV